MTDGNVQRLRAVDRAVHWALGTGRLVLLGGQRWHHRWPRVATVLANGPVNLVTDVAVTPASGAGPPGLTV